MARLSPQQGFTLVEMVIVIVLLGIILTIGVPSYNSLMDSTRVKGAANAVNAFLVNAKSEAIKQNMTVHAVVQVEGSGATWCLGMSTTAGCNCLTPGSCQISGQDRTVSFASYKGVLLNGPDDGHSFSFSPLRGTVTGQETVELESDEGKSVSVTVSQLGRVRSCSSGGWGGYPSC